MKRFWTFLITIAFVLLFFNFLLFLRSNNDGHTSSNPRATNKPEIGGGDRTSQQHGNDEGDYEQNNALQHLMDQFNEEREQLRRTKAEAEQLRVENERLQKELIQMKDRVKQLHSDLAKASTDDSEVSSTVDEWWNQNRVKSNYERECENLWGFAHLVQWRESEKILCKPKAGSKSRSSATKMRCHGTNYKVAESTHNAFCEFENVQMDLSKIAAQTATPQNEFQEFYTFQKGALRGNCELDQDQYSSYVNPSNFQHGMFNVYESFSTSTSGEFDDDQCTEWIEHPVYFAKRFEYYNVYHSMTDFFNAWLITTQVLGISTQDLQVIFLDSHKPEPFLDPVWKDVFSPNHPLLSMRDLIAGKKGGAGGKLCFRRVIFGLPGYQSLLFIDNGQPSHSNKCFASELVKAFRNFVVNAYGLLDTPIPNSPSATVIFRRDYNKHPFHISKRVDRKFANEDEIVQAVARPGVQVRGVDFTELTFREQVKLMRETNILVGAHGAALSHLLFLPDEAVVIEYGDGHHHFRNMAKWANKIYICVANVGRPDRITVNRQQLEGVMNTVLSIVGSFYSSFRCH